MPLTIKTAADLQAEAQARAKASIRCAIEGHIEAQARAMDYNSAAHLAGYCTSSVPEWAVEAQTFVAWRDTVWQAAIVMLAGAEATGASPSIKDVIAALPGWPDVNRAGFAGGCNS